MGRAMLKFMNLTHAPLTNWGLGLIEFQDGWTMLDIGCGGGKTLQRLLKYIFFALIILQYQYFSTCTIEKKRS